MEQLIVQSRAIASRVKERFKRQLFYEIDWKDRLIGVVGARGTGKTTLLLQRMKQVEFLGKKGIYITLDDIYFTEHKLIDTLRELKGFGFTHVFIDEVHQYKGWSREIKNSYDFYPELHILFTGSSVIDIKKEGVDLSRRAVFYNLYGLSFREYLNFIKGSDQKPLLIHDIFDRHEEVIDDILSQIKPLEYWHDYLKMGYYPYFAENTVTYHNKLRKVINTVIESDLRFIKSVSTENTEKIKRLLYIISGSVPFKPNMTKLSERIGIHRNTLVEYLHYLEEAGLVKMLTARGKSTGTLTKPDKLYLENTNISYALVGESSNKGNVRETFFYNQVNAVASLTLPERGDFEVNERYTVEVGGAGKGKKQISGLQDAYIAADDIERGALHKIPLWLFGFLY